MVNTVERHENMEIYQLVYLVEVAKLGAIRKVAKKLEIKQSFITRAIRQLEEEIGCALIYRSNKGVELTNQGKEFVLYANEILYNCDKLKETYLYNQGEEHKKKIHISSDITFFLGEFMKAFHEEHQSIQIYLKETSREQVIEDVINKVCEIGLITLTNREEKVWEPILKEQQLIFHKIKRSKVYVYLGENNPLYTESIIEPEQLEGYPMIYLEGRPELSLDLYRGGEANYQFIRDKILCLGDKHTIFEVIQQTDAYTIGAWCDYKPTKGVKVIPLQVEDIYYEMGWIEKRNRCERIGEEEPFIKGFEAYLRDRGA